VQLNDELFAQIVGELAGVDDASSLTGDDASGASDERRAAPRVSWCAGATIYTYAREAIGPALPVGVQNLSPSGICILQYFLLPFGGQFIVELPVRGGSLLRVLCTVRNWRVVNEDLYAMGAEFEGIWAGAFQPASAQPGPSQAAA
jgi:hypothetical protein